MYTIEKNIPVAPNMHVGARFPALRQTLAVMNVGDSFHLPLGRAEADAHRSLIGSTLTTAGKKQGAKFSSRWVGDGLRIWRIA